jgi:regulatory protein
VPTVTRISPQKKKDRVNVYLDGKFGFGIDYENYVLLKLKVEQELTVQEVEKIKNKADYQKNLGKIINFATRRPRSEQEFKDWLYRKKVPKSQHKKLFIILKKYDYLDDLEFAKWWISERITFSPRGKRALVAELRAKRISSDIIDTVIGDMAIDEFKSAKELVEKNSYKWKGYKGEAKKKKIFEFLARKGYSWEDIKKAID